VQSPEKNRLYAETIARGSTRKEGDIAISRQKPPWERRGTGRADSQTREVGTKGPTLSLVGKKSGRSKGLGAYTKRSTLYQSAPPSKFLARGPLHEYFHETERGKPVAHTQGAFCRGMRRKGQAQKRQSIIPPTRGGVEGGILGWPLGEKK